MSLPTKRSRCPSRDEPGPKRSVLTGIGATIGCTPGTKASVSSLSQLDTAVTAAEYDAWARALQTEGDDAARTRAEREREFAGLYLDRKRGVFEQAAAQVARGNRV